MRERTLFDIRDDWDRAKAKGDQVAAAKFAAEHSRVSAYCDSLINGRPPAAKPAAAQPTAPPADPAYARLFGSGTQASDDRRFFEPMAGDSAQPAAPPAPQVDPALSRRLFGE